MVPKQNSHLGSRVLVALRSGVYFAMLLTLLAGCAPDGSNVDSDGLTGASALETASGEGVAPTWDPSSRELSIPLANSEVDSDAPRRQLVAYVDSKSGRRVLSVRERGRETWAIEIESEALPRSGSRLTIVERSDRESMRITLEERNGWVDETYEGPTFTATGRYSLAHAAECGLQGEAGSCRFPSEHEALVRFGRELALTVDGAPSLMDNEAGLAMSEALASSRMRAKLASAMPRLETRFRDPGLEEVCKWAERGLLKCAWGAWANPLCHAAVGTTAACWISEIFDGE